MGYALQTLWHERPRYASGVLAVTFSAVLIALQCGLLLGLFKITSIPLDQTRAGHGEGVDIWIGSSGTQSVDLGKPIPESYLTRVAGRPGVHMPEFYIANFGNFTKPVGGTELCYLLGSRLDSDARGPAEVLTPELRNALTERDTIVVDESDVERLKLNYPSGHAKINGKEVRLVGTVKGLKSLAAPWVFCSLDTARHLLGFIMPPDHVTYLIAQVDTPERAQQIVKQLREEYPEDMSVYTTEEFSTGSRWYWLFRTKAGIAIGYAALLGLLVGMVITAQTLYSATAASAKEFAILLALGIPRWRIMALVLTQSFWVGVIGVLLAYPICLCLREIARMGNVDVDLRIEIVGGTAIVTCLMALAAGFFALRSVRRIQPMDLLR
jgi:putative ABC transport system permease protein